MITKFKFINDENKELDGELIISFAIEGKKYIVYEMAGEDNEKYDIMHVGELEEKEGKVYIHNITMEENKMIKEKLNYLLNSIK